MNVLDENIPESQRLLLRGKRGRKGMKGPHSSRSTSTSMIGAGVTTDTVSSSSDVEADLVAEYVHRTLRHRELNTKAKRMGTVLRVQPSGVTLWRIRAEREGRFAWQ
jgi:hypothetical protein